MDILSLIFEIRFKENTPLILEDKRKKLAKIVMGEEPRKKPPKERMAVEVNHLPSKTRAVIQENRLAIAIEESDASQAKRRLFELLRDIYREVDYKDNPIVRIGTRTQWIHSWDGSFTSLMERYKAIFYQDCSLVEESSDIAIVFTLEDNGCKVNYSSGPMKPEEAKVRLVFKERELPHDFIFIDIDKYATENPPDNNLRAIKQFISASIEYGSSKANETIEILSEGSRE